MEGRVSSGTLAERGVSACAARGRQVVGSFLLTVLIFSAIRIMVQSFRVVGSSMEPSLHDGDSILADKYTYRWLRLPRRGDLVVFENPHAPDRSSIKRVIGIPGETVEIRDGQAYINDHALDEPYIMLPASDNWGPSIVPPGRYFVLGDNRSYSNDSRTWGWLSEQRIIGKAWIARWPSNSWDLIVRGYAGRAELQARLLTIPRAVTRHP